MTLRVDYASTGDPQTAAEMDLTNTQVNANTVDLATLKLNPISKTAAYNPALPSDFVICDSSTGAFTVTLPTSPADRTRVGVFKVDASTNAVNVTCGGTSTFNVSGGATTLALTDQFAAVFLQYNSASGIWYVLNGKPFYLAHCDNTSDATKWAATKTLTNTRVTKRVFDANAPSSPITIDSDSYDAVTIRGLAVALTINAPSGTPTVMQDLVIRIKDNSTARALTWNAIFRAIGVTLPTTTVLGKTHYIGCKYNVTDTKWDVLAVGVEA